MSFVLAHEKPQASLLSDAELTTLFGSEADVAAILGFEIALARVQARSGMITQAEADEIGETLGTFEPDQDSLSEGMAKDGMIVPDLIRQSRSALPEDTRHALHFGATSQDAIDTSAMMRMKKADAILRKRLASVVGELAGICGRDGANDLMAHTRMQAALSMKASDRINAWQKPLVRLLSRGLEFPVQLGGPVGAANAFGGKGGELRSLLACDLDLDEPDGCWHTDRGAVADIAHWLASVSGHLGKLGQDMALMAQLGPEQIMLSGGGGSSAMAHKKNPVMAETLVSLAHYNAAQVQAIHTSLIHEQERSGAAWTLEWLVMPTMYVATGAALNTSLKLVQSIERIGRS